ncbi:hypothetical protein M9H77_18050 [Catharanthus roseus]|uniref:Uncharacterized protein n=1 Tax=Catharanthus roseus TaxID=4058 RepID=A0ACC0B6J6_CATRO|nr:hypothetical protein M9H77_18050 [Catharanthus roseus]
MTTGVLEGPSSSPTQMSSIMRKVKTIICQCIFSIGGTLGCTPSQYDIQQTFALQPSHYHPREPVHEHVARGVKRGARRLLGGRTREGRAPAPPHPGRRGRGRVVPRHGRERGGGSHALIFTLGLTPDALSHPNVPYAPPPLSAVELSFDAPLPPSTAGSSVPHISISVASSSNSEEHSGDPLDDVTPAQQLSFGPRVRSKTTKFIPSYYR